MAFADTLSAAAWPPAGHLANLQPTTQDYNIALAAGATRTYGLLDALMSDADATLPG